MKKRGNAEGYTVTFLFCQVRKTLDFFLIYFLLLSQEKQSFNFLEHHIPIVCVNGFFLVFHYMCAIMKSLLPLPLVLSVSCLTYCSQLACMSFCVCLISCNITCYYTIPFSPNGRPLLFLDEEQSPPGHLFYILYSALINKDTLVSPQSTDSCYFVYTTDRQLYTIVGVFLVCQRSFHSACSNLHFCQQRVGALPPHPQQHCSFLRVLWDAYCVFVSIMALLTRISVHFIVVLIYIFLIAHVKYFLYLLAMFISFEIYSQFLAILKLHYLVFLLPFSQIPICPEYTIANECVVPVSPSHGGFHPMVGFGPRLTVWSPFFCLIAVFTLCGCFPRLKAGPVIWLFFCFHCLLPFLATPTA